MNIEFERLRPGLSYEITVPADDSDPHRLSIWETTSGDLYAESVTVDCQEGIDALVTESGAVNVDLQGERPNG